jgi:multimeric flavodoxin WrbA
MISLKQILFENSLPSSEEQLDEYAKKFLSTVEHLKSKKKILLLTTSNRWSKHEDDVPKSTQLAKLTQTFIGSDKCELIDVSKLNIFVCEGNVSSNSKYGGNHCGTKEALLKDKEKNPSGFHRCWASLNEKNDELWKLSKPLFESDTVLFFTSIRWGQTNSIYQKLIERLCWIENRHSTLGEDNIVKNIESGIIAIGQNWNGSNVVETQKGVFRFYGFQVPDVLSWNWQYTDDSKDETKKSYDNAIKVFDNTFLENK